eukprot:TRINITY_DN24828_c0_g1_i1.p1 TRINITY_DN24828_c0_g1~~TRINITY_DN24828_c0_g1_i1.p1  ORF type:complete len:418 (-),score=107.38 TRINITY_DN24828_c0_g1_i1:34-1287(-)
MKNPNVYGSSPETARTLPYEAPKGAQGTGGGLLYSNMLSNPTLMKTLPYFPFQERRNRINWRNIGAIDAQKVIETNDLRFLESFLGNVVFAAIDEEDARRFSDPNLLKMFQLSQLATEYMLQLQNSFAGQIQNLDAAYKDSQGKLKGLEDKAAANQSNLRALKSEVQAKRATLETYKKFVEQNAVFKCTLCDKKTFVGKEYLDAHMKRRHPKHKLLSESKEIEELQNRLNSLQTAFAEKVRELEKNVESAGEKAAREMKEKQLEEARRFNAEVEAKLRKEIADLRESNQSMIKKLGELERRPASENVDPKFATQTAELSTKLAQYEEENRKAKAERVADREEIERLKEAAKQKAVEKKWVYFAGELEDDVEDLPPAVVPTTNIEVQPTVAAMNAAKKPVVSGPVSYTHLTLPTIYSV